MVESPCIGICTILNDECVGCNLCMFACPVPDCISMERIDSGTEYQNWTTHPNNPFSKAAE